MERTNQELRKNTKIQFDPDENCLCLHQIINDKKNSHLRRTGRFINHHG